MLALAIRQPVVLGVAILILTLLGILAIFKVPVQMIPDLDARMVVVRTLWPGATPQDVEQEILLAQERYLGRIPGLERMVTTASTGVALVELEFPHHVEMNQALLDVNNALSQVASYPENVDEPTIESRAFSANAFMYFQLYPLDEQRSEAEILALRDWVEKHVVTPMERVPGVASVFLPSGAERQVRIYVDPARLAERGLRLLDVRNAIRARNQDVSGGDLDSGKRRYLLRTVGRFPDVAALNELVIAERSGAFTRLRDVGHAELALAEVREFAYANGRPVLALAVYRQSGTNVIEIKRDLLAEVERLNRNLLAPQGLRLALNSDDVVYVSEAVSVVQQNLLIGALLALVVLFLFLRSPPATLIGALGIPICTIAAFLGLLLTGRTINVISLAGIAFAIGMTLDNNIVVLENIHRHLDRGKERLAAALAGVSEAWPAVLASTLTTICVFLPVIYIEQEAGQLYSDIAVAIAAAILMSMVVAVTLVPALAARTLRVGPGPTGRLARWGQAATRAVAGAVHWQITGWVRPLAVVVVVAAASGATLYYLTPAAEYLPEGEEAKVFTAVFAPPGHNVAVMRAAHQALEHHFTPALGQDPALFDQGASEVPGLGFTISFVNASELFSVREPLARRHADALMAVAGAKASELPGLESFSSRGSIFSGNFGGTRSVNVEVSGADLATLYAAADNIVSQARGLFPGVRVRSDPATLTLGQPLLEVRPIWERAAELGLDTSELGYAIWAYTDGAYVDRFFLDGDEVDLFLYASTGHIEQPQDLAQLPIYSPRGGVVPLSAIANVAERASTETIRRVDGDRTVTIAIVPPRSVPLEEGVRTVRAAIVDGIQGTGQLPAGISLRITGASDQLEATRTALSGNFVVACLIAYLLLVAVFSHWGYPLLIMTSVPIGISGGIGGLYLLNQTGAWLGELGFTPILQPFDMITMLGFLVLIGTVVNNPILIVERAVRSVREEGMAVAAAVVAAVTLRLRPIMMTTITTVAGLSPLVFNPGAGTELYRGLGTIVLTGLLFSTLVTLTFMPALLALSLRWLRPAALPTAAAS